MQIGVTHQYHHIQMHRPNTSHESFIECLYLIILALAVARLFTNTVTIVIVFICGVYFSCNSTASLHTHSRATSPASLDCELR